MKYTILTLIGILIINLFMYPLNSESKYTTTTQNQKIESLEKELAKQKKINAEIRKLLLLDQKAEKLCITKIEDKTEYIKKLEENYETCKRVIKKYERVQNTKPLLTLMAGAGYINSDFPVSGIVGVGIKNFRVWGTVSKNAYGVYGGVEYPLL